jgi:hypothetical protein
MVLSVTLEGPCDNVMKVQVTASVRGQLLSPSMGAVQQLVATGDVKAEDATCKEIKVGVGSCIHNVKGRRGCMGLGVWEGGRLARAQCSWWVATGDTPG